MIYNIDFDIAALYINVVLIFLAVFRKAPPILKNVIFRLMLLSNLLATIFDILSTYTISLPADYSLTYNYLISILYYLCHNYSAFLYVMYGLATDEKRLSNPKIKEVVIVAFIFVVLSIVTTPFTKLVFYFDENLVYQHGPFLYVLYAIALLSVLYVLYLKLTDKENQSTFQLYSSIVYPVALFVAFAIHIFNDSVLIELFAIDLGYLVMYVSLDNPDKYLYKTISIYNRRAFDDYVYRKVERGKEFQVLIFAPKEMDNYNALLSSNKMFAMEKAIIKTIKKLQSDYLFVLSDFCYALVCSDYENEITRINKLLEKSITIGKEEYMLEMSYAIIRYPEVANNLNEFNMMLDDLIYRINNQISNEPLEVDPDVLLVEEKKKQEKVLLDAVKHNKFYVEYEPVFDTNSINALNAEARLMISVGDNTIAMNKELYKLANDDGLIIDINDIVLREVGLFIEESNIQHLGINSIIVNLSVSALMNINYPNRLKEMINKYKLPAKHICFKLFDFDLSTNADTIAKNMKEISALGFKFVVDNYGENSINISAINDLPILGVKLGEKIVKDSLNDKKNKIILVGFINILKELGYAVALSNITSVTEDKLAKSLKVEFVQGPFYGKQMPGNEFINFYKNQLMEILALMNRN